MKWLLTLILASQSYGAISLVAHTSKQLGNASGTTTAIDTTGATLLVVAFNNIGESSCTGGILTDSKSNSWTCIADSGATLANGTTALWYVCNPTVGTGHTFTGSSGLNSFPTLFVLSYSGTNTGSCLDVHSENHNSASVTIQPGSVTPSQTNSLIVTALSNLVNNTFSIDSGFTVEEQQPNTTATAGGAGDIIETSIVAKNPTWTNGGSTSSMNATVIAVFKPASTSSIVPPGPFIGQGIP